MLLHSHCSGDPKRAPIVLIHGLFGSYENLGVIERSLSELFYVINIDVRNHGRSAHSDDMSYPLLAEDVAETLDQLQLAQTAMLGHSMGGKLAMAFALQYPQRVSKLIVADIAPVAYAARHNSIFSGLLAVDLSNIGNRHDADKQLAAYIPEPGVRQFLLKSLIKHNEQFQWRFNLNALKANYAALIAEPLTNGLFAGPVLFIKGGASDYILPEHKETIIRLFPSAEAKIIQGAGHWLHAEKPVVFTKLVQDFLLS